MRVIGEQDCVIVKVLDDGEPGAVSPLGYGLAGMTERAALLGGTLEARPRVELAMWAYETARMKS